MKHSMKSIFLGHRDNIERVFSGEVTQALIREAGLNPAPYAHADLDGNDFADVDCIFSTWGMPMLTQADIAARFPALKAVFYAAGSVQYFARPFLAGGVKVFSAWEANAVPVAEYTAAQIILANKGFFLASYAQSKGDTERAHRAFQLAPGGFGAVAGIIGAGMIGQKVIRHLQQISDIRILVYDPFLSDEKKRELAVETVDLDTLFAASDVVSNHLANNAQTQNMLNFALFSKMKPHAVFLNTGRGAQVNEADLIRHLQMRPDACAVLDVTVTEPPEAGHAFYTLPNVFLTPHIAGSAGNELHRMSHYMLDEFLRYKRGEQTPYEVTEQMLKTMA